jgi:hypothetical protein
VSKKVYLVEISKSKHKLFCVICEDYNNPLKFMGCDIPIHVGNKMIFSECEGDFEKFAKKFFVKFGKLQVTGFHHAQRLLRKKRLPKDRKPNSPS